MASKASATENTRAPAGIVAGQPGRVALAVPALVVAADHLDGAAQRLDAGHHLDPEQRVGPHHLPLPRVQRPGLLSTASGMPTLPTSCSRNP